MGDRLIDGRNRLAACKMAGVEPIFEVISGGDAEALACISSYNLTREHFSEAQLGMYAAKLANLKHGQRKDHANSRSAPVHFLGEAEPVSLKDAAELLNFGTM